MLLLLPFKTKEFLIWSHEELEAAANEIWDWLWSRIRRLIWPVWWIKRQAL